jgi:hypothetical protein
MKNKQEQNIKKTTKTTKLLIDIVILSHGLHSTVFRFLSNIYSCLINISYESLTNHIFIKFRYA